MYLLLLVNVRFNPHCCHIVTQNRSCPNFDCTLVLLFPDSYNDIFDKNSMIRRDPTLIPMSDADVEDVRQMIAENRKSLNRETLEVQSLPGMSKEDDAMFQKLLSELKAKRIGLEPGVLNQ